MLSHESARFSFGGVLALYHITTTSNDVFLGSVSLNLCLLDIKQNVCQLRYNAASTEDEFGVYQSAANSCLDSVAY